MVDLNDTSRLYPGTLYDRLSAYHRSPPTPITNNGTVTVAVDLGCGPGTATSKLAASLGVSRTVGIDPSSRMIEVAKEMNDSPSIEFRVGSAEDGLKSFGDSEVDFVGAAQAAHWFNYPSLYKELQRVLKPGGTVAFWGYAEMFLPGKENVNSLINSYSHDRLGPYWEQPGRSIVEALYDPIPFPTNEPTEHELASSIERYGSWDTTSFRRIKFDEEGSTTYKDSLKASNDTTNPVEPILLSRQWSMAELHEYFKTWSSAHTYNEKQGLDGEGAAGFIINDLSKELNVPKDDQETKFDVYWPLAIVLFKKAS